MKSTTPVPSAPPPSSGHADNATVQTGILTISTSGTVLTVQSTGKDSLLRFNNNDWVEILDDSLILQGLPGEIHQIVSVVDATSTITLDSPVSFTNFPLTNSVPNRLTRIRRWDTSPASSPTVPTLIPADGSSVTLENGITLTFSQLAGGSPVATGQYWNFATRTADSTIEALVQAPPSGIYHHYARLAIVTLAAGSTGTATDCRIAWPPSCSTGCCDCTVNIAPADLTPGNTLQNIVDKYQNQGTTTTFCFAAGAYLLDAPLLLTAAHMNFIFEPCSAATVSFAASDIFSSVFVSGLFVLAGSSNITLNSLEFIAPAGKVATDTFAGLPLSSYDDYVQEYLSGVYSNTCLRLVGTTDVTITQCTFNITSAGGGVAPPAGGFYIPVAIGILANGTCTGLLVAENTFTGGFLGEGSNYGFLQTPIVVYEPIQQIQQPAIRSADATIKTKQPVAKSAPALKKSATEPAAQTGKVEVTSAAEIAKQDQQALFETRQAALKSRLAALPRIGKPFQASAAAATITPSAVAGGSSVLPSLLDQAVFRDNIFSNITYPIFNLGPSGTITCIRNRMTNICGGFWFVEPLRFADLASQIPPEIAYAIGFPIPANFTATLIAAPAVGPSYRVYAGSANYTDSTGAVWTPDSSTPGVTVNSGQDSLVVGNEISDALPGPDDQILYQGAIVGQTVNLTFNDLPTGYYTVTVKIAQTGDLYYGVQVMDGTVNYYNIFQGLDAVDFGQNVAIDVTLPLWVSDGQVTVNIAPNTSSVEQLVLVSAVSVVANWTDPSTSLTTYVTQLPAFYQAMAMNAQQGVGQPQFRWAPNTPVLRIEGNEQNTFEGSPSIVALGQDLAVTGGNASVVCLGNRLSSGVSDGPDLIRAQGVGKQALAIGLNPNIGAPLPPDSFNNSAMIISRYYQAIVNNNVILNPRITFGPGYNSIVVDSDAYAPPFAPANYLPQVMVSGNICQGGLLVSPPRSSYLGQDYIASLLTWEFINSVYPPSTTQDVRQGVAAKTPTAPTTKHDAAQAAVKADESSTKPPSKTPLNPDAKTQIDATPHSKKDKPGGTHPARTGTVKLEKMPPAKAADVETFGLAPADEATDKH